MYDFYYKLVNIALPRVRDFRGISGQAFDGRGNYSLGIKEQIIFPEIEYDKIDKIKGLNISVVTSAKTDEEGKELLRLLGMPLSIEVQRFRVQGFRGSKPCFLSSAEKGTAVKPGKDPLKRNPEPVNLLQTRRMIWQKQRLEIKR